MNSKTFGGGTKTIQHVIAWDANETTTMAESQLVNLKSKFL